MVGRRPPVPVQNLLSYRSTISPSGLIRYRQLWGLWRPVSRGLDPTPTHVRVSRAACWI
ncbi:MAG: hypothetical protein Ct9H300mP1_07070 [Planctomycetaceae bacterium]|nr:MAG: hypothetical protein Ct9H300mP1_07070 [Planctomycetaceae bacterium]